MCPLVGLVLSYWVYVDWRSVRLWRMSQGTSMAVGDRKWLQRVDIYWVRISCLYTECALAVRFACPIHTFIYIHYPYLPVVSLPVITVSVQLYHNEYVHVYVNIHTFSIATVVLTLLIFQFIDRVIIELIDHPIS